MKSIHSRSGGRVFRHERDSVGIVHDVVEGPEGPSFEHAAVCSYRELPIVAELPPTTPLTCFHCLTWDGRFD